MREITITVMRHEAFHLAHLLKSAAKPTDGLAQALVTKLEDELAKEEAADMSARRARAEKRRALLGERDV